MSLIIIPNPLVNGTTAYGSDVIADVNAIASDYNGNIQDVNIAVGAGIQDSKLAQIQSPSKINGSAFTSLANIPATAGQIPSANLPTTYMPATLIIPNFSGADPAGTVTGQMWIRTDY